MRRVKRFGFVMVSPRPKFAAMMTRAEGQDIPIRPGEAFVVNLNGPRAANKARICCNPRHVFARSCGLLSGLVLALLGANRCKPFARLAGQFRGFLTYRAALG